MSVAGGLFYKVGTLQVAVGHNADDGLSRAAELWRTDGQYFSVGVAVPDASTLPDVNPGQTKAATMNHAKSLDEAVRAESKIPQPHAPCP